MLTKSKKSLMKATELMDLIECAENFENEVLQLPINVLDQLWRSWD